MAYIRIMHSPGMGVQVGVSDWREILFAPRNDNSPAASVFRDVQPESVCPFCQGRAAIFDDSKPGTLPSMASAYCTSCQTIGPVQTSATGGPCRDRLEAHRLRVFAAAAWDLRPVFDHREAWVPPAW